MDCSMQVIPSAHLVHAQHHSSPHVLRQVVSVDVGSSVPLIHNLRTLPTPTATIWPQVMFDLHYTGTGTSHWCMHMALAYPA